MSLEGIASRYAQALLEIGNEQGNLATLAQEVRRFGETYAGSAELRSVLGNPLVEEKSERAMLGELCSRLGVGPITKNVVGLLAERKRLSLLPLIARQLDRLSDLRAGVVRAVVTSATELPEAYYVRLKEQLEKSTGKKVVLDRAVDATLLGGVVTRIGDRVIDGSLKTRLATMKSLLLQ